MKTSIGRGVTALLLLTSGLAVAEPSAQVDAAVSETLRLGKDTMSVQTDEWGQVIVAIGTGSGGNAERSLEIARQSANVILTGFLHGRSIDATDSISISRQDGQLHTSVDSRSTVSVDSAVSGAQVYRVGAIDDRTWYVAMILAEKSGALREKLRDRKLESTIQAKGFSPVTGNAADSRRRALADAMRNAVEAFAGVSVAAKSYIRNAEDISSNVSSVSEGRVRQYQIVEESESDSSYTVVIIAEIEERPPGMDDNIEALLENMGRPAFSVSGNSDEVSSMLRELLSKHGFDIASSEETARYLVTAEAFLTEMPVRYGNEEHYSTRTKLSVTVRQRVSSDVLLSVSNNEDESVDISRYPEIGRRNSMTYAVEEISDPLIGRLKSLMVNEFQHGTKILVALEDWFGLRDVHAFEGCLQAMPNVKTVAQFPLEKDRIARFEVLYMDDPGGFQVDFKKHSFTCGDLARVKVRMDSPGRLVFSM